MADKKKRILKELSPSKGGKFKNLNFLIASDLALKIKIKAEHTNKKVNQYIIDLMRKDTADVEVKVR